jgi:hemoglobin-like flavoprotein
MQIEESLNRILSERKLITERFYAEKLFKLCPEFIPYFCDTNMKVQAMMLMMSLHWVACYVSGSYPAVVDQYLRDLGTRHRKQGVPQEFFPKFCEMLVATIAEFHGDAWNEELAEQWRVALARATHTMMEGYKQEYNV